ncbi:MAG: hypothetical protein JO061_21175 [Acidobacteriaceae bacterium]|nr:hypothetical protein [Acidobacteriaceae bacterium]
MDPVTTSIIAFLAAVGGAASTAAQGIVPDIVKDSYAGLKSLIKRKFGEKSELSGAIGALEQKPQSAGKRLTLEEEVREASAHEDPEIQAAAEDLLQHLRSIPEAARIVQSIQGNYNAQAGPGATAVVNIHGQLE